MNILVIGNGGREHALAWQCAKDTRVVTVFVANGNAGTALEPKLQNVAVNIKDHAAVIEFCRSHDIALVVVGPEAPLVAGIVDDLRAADIAVWGPTAHCAQLEGSKAFAKQFMQQHNIPTARYQAFSEVDAAVAYIKAEGAPIVIKADGLAAGKGVIVAQTEAEAVAAVEDMLAGNKFGDAGSRVVIEQFLAGEEASFICMIDGQHILPMATSQDHKRIGEGDTGANTGGMGAYSPAPVVTPAVHDKVITRIIEPVVKAMQDNGSPYTGFLYAGLMIDDNGDPFVIEFNCRFGDPETQPIMLRLQASLVELMQAGVAGNLPSQTKWDSRPALGIVLAAQGYPESAKTGDAITGLPDLSADHSGVKVFHAGTRFENRDLDTASMDKTELAAQTIVTNGGRVLCVTALGDDLADAQTKALATCAAISFDGMQYRRDIGWRALARNG